MQSNTLKCSAIHFNATKRLMHMEPGAAVVWCTDRSSLEYTLQGTVQIKIQIQYTDRYIKRSLLCIWSQERYGAQIDQAWVPTGLPSLPFSQLRILYKYTYKYIYKYKIQITIQNKYIYIKPGYPLGCLVGLASLFPSLEYTLQVTV